MEFGQSTAILETNIDQSKQTSFKIQQNRKSFEILSKELYTDEIGSIIREICCNAYDSHIMAGKEEVPIKVVLPSLICDTFSVEDFGLGLSEEDVLNLYTTYFQSTKDRSNDCTGAFGLGSKTPFCYTDSFSIESNFRGVTKQYIVYVDPVKGIPAINKVSEEITLKSNGFKVSFSVKEADFSEFFKKAKDILIHFKVLPDVVGLDLKEHVLKYTFGSKNFRIFNKRGYDEKLLAVMGNVAYPIDPYMLPDGKSSENILRNASYLFDIGDLTVTASRDSLRYDKKTIEAIKKKADEAHDDIKKMIQENIDLAPNLFEARLIFSKMKNQIDFRRGLARFDNYKKDGIELKDSISVKTAVGEIFVRYLSSKGRFNKKNEHHLNFTSWSTIQAEDFFLIDDKKNYLAKTLYYMKTNKKDVAYQIFLYSGIDPVTKLERELTDLEKETNLKVILDHIGIPSCKKISELEIPTDKKEQYIGSSSGSKSVARKKNKFNGELIKPGYGIKEINNEDIDKFKYYVIKKNKYIEMNGGEGHTADGLYSLLKFFRFADDVIIIPSSHTKVLTDAKAAGLTTPREFLIEKVAADPNLLMATVHPSEYVKDEVVDIIEELMEGIAKVGQPNLKDSLDPIFLQLDNLILKSKSYVINSRIYKNGYINSLEYINRACLLEIKYLLVDKRLSIKRSKLLKEAKKIVQDFVDKYQLLLSVKLGSHYNVKLENLKNYLSLIKLIGDNACPTPVS